MVSGLFFCRPIIKILFCRFTISSFMIIYQRKFPGNFMKTSRKSREISQKHSGILPTPQPPIPPTPYPPTPVHPYYTPYPHWNFKLVFLGNTNWIKFTVYFLPPSYIYRNLKTIIIILRFYNKNYWQLVQIHVVTQSHIHTTRYTQDTNQCHYIKIINLCVINTFSNYISVLK